MEIEVGEFVRTYNGIIGTINKIEPIGKGLRYAGEYSSEEIIQINDGHVYERRLKRKDIVKHSKHIIDLIEVGDIVKVLFNKKTEEILTYTIDCEADLYLLTEENLKTILTHEQFEKNAFRLEEWK